MKGIRSRSLYMLHAQARQVDQSGVSNAASSEISINNEMQMWHKRLGHLGQKGLEVLAKRGCFEKDKIEDLKFCEDYMIGKMHRVSFATAKHVTKNKLDYIRSNQRGSPNVP